MKDIILDENNEPIITDGDLTVGNSDEQHIMHVLQITPGMFKQYPSIGIGAISMLNGTITLKELLKIKQALRELGYSPNISYLNGNLIIETHE